MLCVDVCVLVCTGCALTYFPVYICVHVHVSVSIRAGWGEGLSRGHAHTRFLDGAGIVLFVGQWGIW